MTVETTDSKSHVGSAESSPEDVGPSYLERYKEILTQANEALGKVDWGQISLYGKAVAVIVGVIVAQVLIKGIIDTINLLPVVPGLLELFGLVVAVRWSWRNLATSEKRTAVVNRAQSLRKDYLG